MRNYKLKLSAPDGSRWEKSLGRMDRKQAIVIARVMARMAAAMCNAKVNWELEEEN